MWSGTPSSKKKKRARSQACGPFCFFFAALRRWPARRAGRGLRWAWRGWVWVGRSAPFAAMPHPRPAPLDPGPSPLNAALRACGWAWWRRPPPPHPSKTPHVGPVGGCVAGRRPLVTHPIHRFAAIAGRWARPEPPAGPRPQPRPLPPLHAPSNAAKGASAGAGLPPRSPPTPTTPSVRAQGVRPACLSVPAASVPGSTPGQAMHGGMAHAPCSWFMGGHYHHNHHSSSPIYSPSTPLSPLYFPWVMSDESDGSDETRLGGWEGHWEAPPAAASQCLILWPQVDIPSTV